MSCNNPFDANIYGIPRRQERLYKKGVWLIKTFKNVSVFLWTLAIKYDHKKPGFFSKC